MGLALELACVGLQLRNRYDAANTAMVAEKIIAMAKTGEPPPLRRRERRR